jgi:hypothetical protein
MLTITYNFETSQGELSLFYAFYLSSFIVLAFEINTCPSDYATGRNKLSHRISSDGTASYVVCPLI